MSWEYGTHGQPAKRRLLRRYIPYADGWDTYELKFNWRCRDCGTSQGNDQPAWYLRDIGPFCTRCRNKAVQSEGSHDGR